MAAITVAAVCEGKVQAAVGRRRGRRVQIRQLGEAQLPEGCLTGSLQVDPAALQSALADFWQDQRLPVRRVALLLGGRPFVCRQLCLPHMRPGRLRGVLRHEMDTAGEIADPLDDYMLLDRDLRRGTDTVLATRVERGVIGDWAELARALGLGLVSIDLAAAGLIRLVRALPEHRQRTFLVLVPEGGFLSAFLFDRGLYRYAARSRLREPWGTPGCADEILQRVSGIVQFYQTEKSSHPFTHLYFGGGADRELAACAPGAAALGLQAQRFPDSPLVQLPEGWSLADCLYTAGALMD